MPCADDEVYRRWFERHRATSGQLATQRAAERGLSPLVSIVVPCFRSNGSYLVELIDSVLAQSYARWELLLVDGSPEDGVVAQAVAKASDNRIRIIASSENTDIVSNTNAGIEASRGELIAFLDHDDLLEPDALHCYVAALEADPGISVLYSDEDHIGEDGLLCQPVIKSALDVDLLYSHNCVTHFLAVRAELLDQIGLSSVDVAGAQDYDLTLRALAAGAKFKYIPRVLYHWRMHAGSTAGDSAESKPYAHTAGRLALERHFVQRGIAATVEDAGEPFVYRVRYELPQPHPLVSVVIPSRDHADMLEECVASFLEHSTYDNLEFVIVENNSEQPETFACYDRLIERGAGRVRIVTWKGEVSTTRLSSTSALRRPLVNICCCLTMIPRLSARCHRGNARLPPASRGGRCWRQAIFPRWVDATYRNVDWTGPGMRACKPEFPAQARGISRTRDSPQ